MKLHVLPSGIIHEGNWLHADLVAGYTLAIVDGPYGMGKAAWDRMKVDELAEWYLPHLDRLTDLMAASASVYLWNTAEGWARIDPVMRGLGWEFRALVTWDKGNPASLVGWRTVRAWLDVTEVCGFYVRGDAAFQMEACIPNVWRFSVSALAPERLPNSSAAARQYGLLPGRIGGENMGLHLCQKPLLFAERMIRASTRPGDRVLVPFGGTNREAVVMEWIARTTPEEARSYDSCELNADPGKDYIGPVLAQIAGRDTRPRNAQQAPLFARNAG